MLTFEATDFLLRLSVMFGDSNLADKAYAVYEKYQFSLGEIKGKQIRDYFEDEKAFFDFMDKYVGIIDFKDIFCERDLKKVLIGELGITKEQAKDFVDLLNLQMGQAGIV
jgi:hypothetical protein